MKFEGTSHFAKNGDSKRTGCGVRITHDMYATRWVERINCESCLESAQYLDALAQSMEDSLREPDFVNRGVEAGDFMNVLYPNELLEKEFSKLMVSAEYLKKLEIT
jgi:hypothetical protein